MASASDGHDATGAILLDAGTNELEALVFRLEEGWYGVNVAKVREVIQPIETTKPPQSPPSIEGVFNIRGSVVPLIDLKGRLGLGAATDDDGGAGRVIITEFNGQKLGFRVDAVDQIRRLSWSEVRPAPEMQGKTLGVITGIIELERRLVLMIDFESVADSISMEEKLHQTEVPNQRGIARQQMRVMLVEDSPFMRERMREIFVASGYERLEVYNDGLAAWNAISAPGEPIDAIVSDIEMPRMDGLHLAKRLKEHDALREIPVLLFSSLISDDNLKKGKQVGADMQIPKPELPELVLMVDELISAHGRRAAA